MTSLRRHPITGMAEIVETVERDAELMLMALETNRHRFERAAEALGISRRHFSRLAGRYRIRGTLKNQHDEVQA